MSTPGVELTALTPGLLQDAELPPALVLGRGSVQGSMTGSALAPEIRTTWAAEGAEAHGTADFSPLRTAFACTAPAVEGSAVLRLKPPDMEAMKAAVTQAQVAAAAAQVRW